ncbi:hypothetical protein RHGRI_022542 [Rhododendron griersonianum]|uniref:Protein kinase domain-containing protein n=1 Tax=Rhododendron griersonianum TaxID=479676 RepID=A0AAV6J156_9ERIC|nr:hypothetical protein RHGRI_022542 [Rhododendron griersonianum]
MLAAVLLCFEAVAAQILQTFTATYGPFNESNNDIFQLNGATISNGALQLTPDTLDSLKNQSGRVMLRQRFKFWEKSERVASFYSSFLFNIYAFGNTTPGEGLAFVLAPDTYLPSNSYGQYLGLTNSITDGSPKNRLVAIEFDTVKQAFDPDANHVGLNINSIVSTINASLTPFGIELAPEGEAQFYNVWVDYNGVNKVIEVYIARQAELDGETPSKPDTPVLKYNLDLREVLDQYSYFSFSASTGSGEQLNSVFRWNLIVDSYPQFLPPPSNILVKVWVGVGVPMLLILGAAVMGFYYLCSKQYMVKSESNFLLGALLRLLGTPREFQFKDLKMATNNFDEKKKLGQGGFGVVYRGHLHNENLEVAVKLFSRETLKGQDDFLAELTIINRLRHKHLVSLLGRILDAVEERLGDEYVIEAQKMLVLALACSHPIAGERPKTQAIVQIIAGLVPVPYVPPFKPAFVWPSMPVQEEDDMSSLASTTETKSFPTTHLGSGFTPQCISRELYASDKFNIV